MILIAGTVELLHPQDRDDRVPRVVLIQWVLSCFRIFHAGADAAARSALGTPTALIEDLS
ncbi:MULTISPECIES: hypothetical protein [unclassified Frankia]|uniref:hypothetical protein n=1 Tax=unclassified Frankia TaxID=2632575 RepID=UPI002AD25532|nr:MULTISPECIES: hypothetical protein [unclassified Frankia]